jgi:pimeloyl-ACP methyl ester carboxylesterase
MTSRRSAADRPGRRRLLAGLAAIPLAACAAGAGGPMTPADAETYAMQSPPPDAFPRETFVTVEGIALRALVAGRGAVPVVLLHGASGNANDWTFGMLQGLAQGGAVVAFDRPGIGGSDAPETGVESPFVQASLMAAGLQALGHRQAILVGHSYGGSVALAWALSEPERVRGLVLLASPSQVWPGGVGRLNDVLATPVVGSLLASIASAAVPRGVVETAAARVFAPQEPPPGYVAGLGLDRVLDADALRTNARQLTALKDHIRTMVPRYPGLAMPTRLLHGDVDDIVPLGIHSEPLASQIPGAQLTVLRGVGHMPHHAAADSVRAAVNAVRRAAQG